MRLRAIGGRAVGIVANQKTNQCGHGRHGGGGRHASVSRLAESSTPRARKRQRDSSWTAIRISSRSIFLHDVNGFMVGKDAEWSGIIRAGAKMVLAVSTSVVPKIAVIVGGALAPATTPCREGLRPRLLFARPTARMR